MNPMNVYNTRRNINQAKGFLINPLKSVIALVFSFNNLPIFHFNRADHFKNNVSNQIQALFQGSKPSLIPEPCQFQVTHPELQHDKEYQLRNKVE